jgi:hypothetical protein
MTAIIKKYDLKLFFSLRLFIIAMIWIFEIEIKKTGNTECSMLPIQGILKKNLSIDLF